MISANGLSVQVMQAGVTAKEREWFSDTGWRIEYDVGKKPKANTKVTPNEPSMTLVAVSYGFLKLQPLHKGGNLDITMTLSSLHKDIISLSVQSRVFTK